MPAGDKEYPVREGWLKKQSGGQNAAGRSRRRSIGEFVKKWDERYFVLTMNRLCYYKTQQGFKNGEPPSGVILVSDHVSEAAPGVPNEFALRSGDRTFKLSADDEGIANRWLTAWKAMQVSSLAEWTCADLCNFGNMCGFPEAFVAWLRTKQMTGEQLSHVRDAASMMALGYTGRADTIWSFLNNLKMPEVHDWLRRFSDFCQKNAAKRQLANHEMNCLIRLGKGLAIMNEHMFPGQAVPAPPPAPAPAAYAPAPSEKDVKLAQKLGQLPPFLAVLPQECMGQLASFGPT